MITSTEEETIRRLREGIAELIDECNKKQKCIEELEHLLREVLLEDVTCSKGSA